MMRGRRILLAVTGSIAAYKAAFLTRELVKAGVEVRVLLTKSATSFVSPLTFSTLSRAPVLQNDSILDREKGEWSDHIQWAQWPDRILIAPATAHTIANLAQGMADDLLGLIYLSATCPVHFAPAMDLEMHRHQAVQANIRILQQRGDELIPAQKGELASGLEGFGRMEEPEAILRQLEASFSRSQTLTNKRVLITGGPTQESIDPVRYIGNRSSGKMGIALAEEAAARGAQVLLILGPSEWRPQKPGITIIDVGSAREMYEACVEHFQEVDLGIMAAAVADHRPVSPQGEKIKRGKQETLDLELEPTEDILG
ncbi:MAG: bifunctional phosphopantothenoylcysteine decarboxylase/phosphopantothenate--cysteine ligase CoaBC, partial [Flavobacteriales bacterium]